MFRVKPLRLANFRAVLDDLAEAAGWAWRTPDSQHFAAEASSASEQLLSVLNGAGDSSSDYAPAGRLNRLYAEGSAAAQADQSPPDDRDSIARELRLHSGLSIAQLHRLRRDFASRNHPDRLPEILRELATRRMTLANELIDQALKSAIGR
jgi:hypothetical protein